MNKYHFSFKYAIIIILLCLTSTLFAQEIIIAHPNVIVDTLSDNDIKNIFLGKKTYWPNGERIIVVIQKQSIVHENFLNNYINMTSIAFRNYWRKRVFSGIGLPPESFDSDHEIIQYISKVPGSISYINNNLTNNTIKILSIK